MVKKLISILLLLMILLFVVITLFSPKHSSSNLNLILISVDTLRPDHMGVYGYNKNTTPHIDVWAKNAVVFTNAYTTVPETYPSLVGLMTGKNPLTTKVIDNGSDPLESSIATLPTMLKKSGYTTAGFISNIFLDSTFGPKGTFLSTNLKKGFDTWTISEYLRHKYLYADGDKTQKDTYEEFFNNSLSWLKANRDKKLFFWVHLMDPHVPYAPNEQYRCIFGPQYCGILTYADYARLDSKQRTMQGCHQVSKEDSAIYQTLYDGEIASFDEKFGKLIDVLQETGLDKNSVVVLYGDHGEGFDHNHYFSHGDVLYNSNVKIPVMIKLPKVETGKKTDYLIDNTDILPTLLNVLHVPDRPTYALDGTGFDEIFSSPNPPAKKQSVYSLTDRISQISVVNNKYKYIYYFTNTCAYNTNKEELFDLSLDPLEITNLVQSHPDIARSLKQELFAHLPQRDIDAILNKNKYDASSEKLDKLKSLGY